MRHEDLLAIDRAHIWHPYTQMKDYEQEDHLLITHAEGPYLFDHLGNRYYDAIGSWWTTVWGHRYPPLIEAIRSQLERLDHVLFAGCTHPPAIQLVNTLSHTLHPSLSRFFFSDDGSTAVEVALKMAYQYYRNRGEKGRELFIHLKDSYHGDTSGCMSVGGIEIYFSHYRGLMVQSVEVLPPLRKYASSPPPFTEDGGDERVLEEGLTRMEEVLHRFRDKVAGVIVEPILMGAAGMQVYSPRYLRRLRELTSEYQILLIFDEVVTGCGRTGAMWAYEQAGVVPDILVAAKGLTGGMLPLALTVTTDEIYYAFYDDYLKGKTFFHGHSYTANPIACALAHANATLLRESGILETNKETWEIFHRELLGWRGTPWVGDIRFIGCVGAVDVVRHKQDEREIPFPAGLRIGRRIAQKGRQHGLLLRPLGDTIYWIFRLNATPDEVRGVLHTTYQVIEETIWEVKNSDALS
ncbi:adenosylmethionine--8-amino-7-oxononanoate transaminase [Spirochaeta thermophila]|uniref:Adenosylmethionine-8-amino-7-oxononanoate aminotransferase n=1 Tax=Winmispira thermophila (strain ATCC 49972 / DSM 6192 / RI 19.B1) TaxID=665571 RepID=E0RU45_WINT6|nr:adenosylmethionine--8-amino-7-oxononanoate transaminase [Spirochaeta thermophila]ADN02266.1 adenosylmethionine-8-amino-7-oxononanoate aminotransferase [Spirochaeta thermophila DSM 6192]